MVHSSGRRLGLLLRSLFWTILVPGTVTILIPYWVVTRWSPTRITNWGLAQFAGLIPIALGAAILIYSIWSFAVQGWGTLSPLDPPRNLVVTGLYRYVRNPMYVGVLMILLGEALWFESNALFAYGIGWFLVVNLAIVLYEEPSLRRRYGATYERYCGRVGRWVPWRRFDDS